MKFAGNYMLLFPSGKHSQQFLQDIGMKRSRNPATLCKVCKVPFHQQIIDRRTADVAAGKHFLGIAGIHFRLSGPKTFDQTLPLQPTASKQAGKNPQNIFIRRTAFQFAAPFIKPNRRSSR